jgi:hypothetical protein
MHDVRIIHTHFHTEKVVETDLPNDFCSARWFEAMKSAIYVTFMCLKRKEQAIVHLRDPWIE